MLSSEGEMPVLEAIDAIDVRFAGVSVVKFDWPKPAEVRDTYDRPQISFWRGQAGYHCEGYFVGGTGRRTPEAIGSVFFVPEAHEFASKGTGGPVRAVNCTFDPDYFADITATRGAFSHEQLLRGLDLRSSQVRALMVRLMEETLSPGFASEALVECLCGALALEWAREILHRDEMPHGRQPLSRRQLRNISERLLDNGQPFPSVMELAELAGFGNRHLNFCRAYRKQTGRTISSDLRAARFDQAQHLLLNSDLPLKEIAYRLGFSTTANFSTSFQAEARMPPGSFRREHHNAKLAVRTARAIN